MANVLRNIPTLGELLETPPLKSLVESVSRNVVVSRARQFLDDMRAQVQSAAASVHVPTAGELAARIADWIAAEQQPLWQPVINATGIVLHPRLGRAPLAEEALQAIAATGRGYASLGIDLASGEPGDARLAIERLLTKLTGAEAAIVVSSQAAAALLALTVLCQGREVAVARGQIVESGDDYRLLDIIAASGAKLHEVGSTNKTRSGDYATLVPHGGVLLHVHPANYAIAGEAEDVPLAELVAVGHRRGLTVIDDLQNAALGDLTRYGIRAPLVGDSIRAGADVVLFGGDDFVGGPPCGIIVGRTSHLQPMLQHPLARILQADKLTLAALAATLRLHEDPELAERSVPVLSLVATPLENLQNRAERLAPQLAATGVATVEITPGQVSLTGNALPDQTMATVRLALTPLTGSAAALADSLRRGTPAVLGRVEDERLIWDLRSVPPRDDAQLVAALEAQRPQKTDTPA